MPIRYTLNNFQSISLVSLCHNNHSQQNKKMKKNTEKKLNLGKIKVASLSKEKQQKIQGGQKPKWSSSLTSLNFLEC